MSRWKLFATQLVGGVLLTLSKDMVKSLELIDTVPLVADMKIK